MEEKEIVAKNLALYRKKAGISQLELAKKLNYSNKNVSKWENGETTPSIFILHEIAKLYGVSVDDFLQEATVDKQEEVVENAKASKRRLKIFRMSMLLLSNAILFAVATVIIYILGIFGVTTFNKWLVYFYVSPLCVLSVVIYVRVLCKYVSILGVSAIGWLLCGMFFLSFSNVRSIALIFVLGAAYQFIATLISILVNLHLSNLVSTKFNEIKKKIRKKREK